MGGLGDLEGGSGGLWAAAAGQGVGGCPAGEGERVARLHPAHQPWTRHCRTAPPTSSTVRPRGLLAEGTMVTWSTFWGGWGRAR